MVVRSSVDPEDVARAVGRPVRDAEPRLVQGALASLFHQYVADDVPPRRPSLVRVLPYADETWVRAAKDVVAVDVAAWRAWWRWVREGLGTGDGGVWPVPPLVGPVDEQVRPVDVAGMPGLVRPLLDWPDVVRSGLPEERVARLWPLVVRAADEAVGPAVLAATGRRLRLPAGPSAVPPHRLLTDGRHLVPTSWWPFDPALAALDARRPRT